MHFSGEIIRILLKLLLATVIYQCQFHLLLLLNIIKKVQQYCGMISPHVQLNSFAERQARELLPIP
jgi:hypothetical protein